MKLILLDFIEDHDMCFKFNTVIIIKAILYIGAGKKTVNTSKPNDMLFTENDFT